MDNIEVRSELPGDEEAIHIVTCRAFMHDDEGQIIDDMRKFYPYFERRLSITAWHRDKLVGHTLFTPVRLWFMGSVVRALAVGPVAVAPEYQRRGIGGRVLRFGHELGRSEGFSFAYLLGHSSYYPRNGYQINVHGFCKIEISVDRLPEPGMEFDAWPVQREDLPWLVERLKIESARVDFGLQRSAVLSEWRLSGIDAIVWRNNSGERVAYTMRPARQRDKVDLLLAKDEEIARQVIYTLRPREITLHQSGWLAQNAIDPFWAAARADPSEAAMAIPLLDGALDEYLAAVGAGRPIGCAGWPLPFLAH